jgi:chaperonin GroES
MGTQSRRSLETVRHQLKPLFDQVVVKELDQDRVRRSGLVVPPGTDEPPPQPGDHVVFPSAAGVWVEVDEERLLVCRVGEILGILESLEIERHDS